MKVIVLATVFFAWVGLGMCGAVFSEAVQQSQRDAVQTYPELGIENSPLNNIFTEFYRTYQYNNPAYFKNDQWPLQLAKACAQELTRREKEQAETEAQAEKERAAIEIRRQTFKDFHAPEPAKTPFDSDPQERKEYLAAYQDGYRETLITKRRIRFPVGPCTPHMTGWNEGIAAAYRTLPEVIARYAVLNCTPQPTAAPRGSRNEIVIDLRSSGE